MSHPNQQFMKKYLAPLVGCVVKEIKNGSNGFTAIVFVTPSGERFECELSSDTEGNDPGFLFGLPPPR